MPGTTGRQAERGHRKGRTAWPGRVGGVLAAGAAAALALPAGTALASVPPGAPQPYSRTDLVSSNPKLTPTADPSTVDPWGVAEFPQGPLWVSNEGRGNTTLYGGADPGDPHQKLNPVPLVVSIPGGHPTGQAFNTTVTGGSPRFTVTDGKSRAPAVFLFATLKGVIAGWAPTVGGTQAHPATAARVGARVRGAVFTGLAQQGHRLYAADAAHRSVDVFGPGFHLLKTPGRFRDPLIPRSFAPFNIAAIGPAIVVTYAAPRAHLGAGFVDVFSPGGMLLKRLIRGGMLDQPWGVALAQAGDFGPFGGDLLIGNHGNGQINAFDPRTGRFLGTLRLGDGKPFIAPNLWGLIFGDGPSPTGNPPSAGSPSSLFFTAGTFRGAHGVIGEINVTN